LLSFSFSLMFLFYEYLENSRSSLLMEACLRLHYTAIINLYCNFKGCLY
jgi:hypothetical protein